MVDLSDVSRFTETKKRKLRKKKSRERRKTEIQVTKPTPPVFETPVRCSFRPSMLDGVQTDAEVEYVSAPRDFSTFFVGETKDERNETFKEEDSDFEVVATPKEKRRRRRSPSSSSSDERIDGMAAVNQANASNSKTKVCFHILGRVRKRIQSYFQQIRARGRSHESQQNGNR